MRSHCLVLVGLLSAVSLTVGGCDRGARDESSTDTNSEGNAESGDPSATCEIASVVELADGDVVAPNGRSGSEILAAVPEAFQTTLHWNLSNSKVEVSVGEAFGQSTTLNLTFVLPPDPKFYFEDRVVAGDSAEAVCDDYVKVALDVKAETQDGALAFELPGVDVKLGPDDPSTGYWAKPFMLATRPLMSPVVEFVAPVAQPADSEKAVAMSFDDPGVTGSLTVYATTSVETYRIVVARW